MGENKNNDYHKSSDLKKLFERYDCNMNAIFEEWKNSLFQKNTIYITFFILRFYFMIDLIMPLFCSLYANYDLLGFPASRT